MTFEKISSAEFESFTINYKDKSIFQTKEYGFVMNDQEFYTEFYGLKEGSNIIAASLILIKNDKGYKYAYAPRGFLLDYSNYSLLETFTKLLIEKLNKEGIVAIKLAPMIKRNDPACDLILENMKKLKYWHFGFNNFFEALKPRYEAVIDLTPSLNDIFYKIDRNYRKNIKGADSKGIRIVKGDKSNLNYLYEQTKRKYVRDLKFFESAYNYYGTSNSIEFYYAKLDTSAYLEHISKKFELAEQKNYLINDSVASKDIRNSEALINKKMESDKEVQALKKELVVARKYFDNFKEGIIIATALIVKNRNSLYLLMDGIDKHYKHLSGKHLLIWKLIEKYNKLNYSHFNLGGITNPDMREDNKYKGLNDFKLGLGSEVVEYVGDFERIINSNKYFFYKKSIPLFGFIKL